MLGFACKKACALAINESQTAWMQSGVNRQEEESSHRRPDKSDHLEPTTAAEAEVLDSVETNPFAALRFSRGRLTDNQTDRAINLSIEGGIIFAFERVPAGEIQIALRESPALC